MSVSDDLNGLPPVRLSDEYLLHVFSRIEAIEAHFDMCCAFNADRCHYGDEFNHLFDVLKAAGMPDHKLPCDRTYFDAWMMERA